MQNLTVSTEDIMSNPEDFARAYTQLSEQVTQLQHQLDWFKRQLFGQKSEQRHIEPNPHQLSLLGRQPDSAKEPPEEKRTVKAYQRGSSKKDRGNAVNDSGLRFDESVEVKELSIIPHELKGPDADQYDIIGE